MIEWVLRNDQTLTLITLGVFYIAYLIKMLLLRMDGISGNQLGKGSKPAGDRIIEICLRTVTLAGAAVQLTSVALPDMLRPLSAAPVIRVIGMALLLPANVFFIMAMATMRKNWRAGYAYGQRTQLVTDGVYRISRNPAFVGFDLLYIGCAAAFPNILNLSAAAAAIILFHVQIRGEEHYLAETFGQRYTSYKSQVRRYL